MNTMVLRYVIELAVHGSAQKAADSLGVSRTSITRSIKKLEDELGAQLFINTSEGAVPTIAGDTCLRFARQILRTENDLQFDLAHDSKYSGTVNIGIGINRTQHILPFVLPEFYKKYPNIKVKLREKSNSDMETALLNYQLDFALLLSTDPVYFDFQPLYTENFVLVAPKEDLFTKTVAYTRENRPYVTLEKYKDKPFVLGHYDQKSYKICEKIFAKAAIEPNIILQTKSSLNSALLAYEGMGYAIVPESYTVIGSYRRIPYYYLEKDLNASWVIGIATKKGEALTHAAIALKEEIINAYENHFLIPALENHMEKE